MKSSPSVIVSSVLVLAGCGSGSTAMDMTQVPDMVQSRDMAERPDMAELPDMAAVLLALPGDSYYPESLTAGADGTLYVPSLGTGQISAFAPGATTPTTFLAAGNPKGIAGAFADSASSTLYACAVDLSVNPPATEVRTYDLAAATLKKTYSFPGPAFCNDFALDGSGNLFVTDSFGNVYQLPKGGSALALWKSDPLLQPSTAMGFGADGIVVDGSSVYVTAFSDSRLVRIPVNGDGTAGAAVEITVTPALAGPDGMRLLAAGTLVLVEGFSGKLTKVVVSGNTATSTVLASGLNGPTSVVKVGSLYWVSEGQIGHLTGQIAGPPSLPFDLRPFPAM